MKERTRAQQINDEKIEAVWAWTERYFNKKCKGSEAALFIKLAGDMGALEVAIIRASKWTTDKGKMIGAIRRELQNRRKWPDEEQTRAKALTDRFNGYLDQMFGSPMGNLLGNIRKEIDELTKLKEKV